MKNKNTYDYTYIQLKAFLELLFVAIYVSLTFFIILLMRYYGLGVNAYLYFGIILIMFILLLFIIFIFSRKYIKPFQDIDNQLDMLLSGKESKVQLSRGLIFIERRINLLKEKMEKRLFDEQLVEQQKKDLVMYLAHDIRTPLTSIIGYLNLIDEAKDIPKGQREKYIHIVLEKAYNLENMFNEFFEITRYSLHQIQLNKENIDICYMLVQLTDELLPLLNKNGNKSIIQMESEDIFVYGDRDKLARVFNNVLKNAIMYSYSNTEIVISVKQYANNVEISFCNQGKQISSEKLEKIFEKFYRIDEARNTDLGGTGLGLAISKEIVMLHGGTISAKSEDNFVTINVILPTKKDLS